VNVLSLDEKYTSAAKNRKQKSYLFKDISSTDNYCYVIHFYFGKSIQNKLGNFSRIEVMKIMLHFGDSKVINSTLSFL
jgi:hypothetical protein